MEKIKTFEKFANKMTKIAEEELLRVPGGDEYFDNIDAALKLPQNLDVIKAIFTQIQKEQGTHFNLILSGGFGDWVMSLIKKGVLKVPGNLVATNGSLRGGHDTLDTTSKGKEIDIVHKKKDIDGQKFIMFDDSYYSGSTKKAIDDYLKKFNSEIYKTYVLYDGNDKIDSDRISLYRYYDYHNGTKLGVDMLIDYLYSLDVDIPIDIIKDKIIKSQIHTINDIRNEINKIRVKFGKPVLKKLTHKEIDNVIKSFENFEYEEELVFEVSSYLNLHGDDDYDIEQVKQDDRHEYSRVDGILYELSLNGDDIVVDIDSVEATDENLFYEEQIERYIEYFENGGIVQTFPVQASKKCYDLECMMDYLEEGDNFDEMYDLLKVEHDKLYDIGLSDLIVYPEKYGFPIIDFSQIKNEEDLEKYYYEGIEEDDDELEYDEEIYNGLVAIIDYFADEEEYTLTDFNHRFEALKRMGKKEVMIDIQ